MGGGGPEREDVLLDLSSWPQLPDTPVRRPVLPPRPAGRRRWRAVPLRGLAVAALVLGAVLLAAPLPGTGCPSALASWAAGPRPLPTAQPPSLDDAAVAADRTAVAAARAALIAHDAQVAAAQRVLDQRPATTAAPHPAGAAALEASVRTDTAERDRAKAARDRLVEQQQAAVDPSAYDADVAAAQEDLDVAEARLADDRKALAAARQAPAPSPSPSGGSARTEARAVVAHAAAVRTGLVQALSGAQQAQAQHLAARRDTLAAWAARHAHQVSAVRAANARRVACSGTAGPPGTAGAVLGVTGVGLLGLRLRRLRRLQS